MQQSETPSQADSIPARCSVVGVVSTGKEAIEACAKAHLDIVLMDLRMPGGGGIMAIQAIHDQYPDIQVIALTSGFLVEAEEALAAGASAYIFKSVSIYEILETVRKKYAENHPIQ